MSEIGTRRLGPVAALLALLLSPSLASAVKYGEVEVTVHSEPRGSASHGYAEIEFLVANRSQESHEVQVTYPQSSYGYGDYLRAVSRTVTVEAGKSVRVALAYPERISISGGRAAVAIDGREQDEGVSVSTGSSSRSYSYGSSSYGSGPRLLALYSKAVDTRFPDWVNTAHWGRGGGPVGGGPSGTGPEAVRADRDAREWSANWLAYSRYDGVAVTADDLQSMPAEVRNALGQYVECGGSLLVLGRDPQLPGPWKLSPLQQAGPLSSATPGFGHCFATDRTDLSRLTHFLNPVIESWRETARPFQRTREPGDANRAFPVVEDIGVPVRGLLALMFLFAIAIGPVNMFVLARKRRKLWLFWTVPVISFFTCLAVLGYMALTEGWQGRGRVEGFTVLDENTRRASSIGFTGFYTPLLPGGGLRFAHETEVAYQNGDDSSPYSYRRRGSGSALTIDWTREQHLASGWLTPRVPAHFALRKSELRRERVTIAKGAGGSVEAVNGLGADVSEFWYADEAGVLYQTEAIPAGGRATLTRVPGVRQAANGRTLRGVYAGDWTSLLSHMKANAPALLAPRTYFAVMESAPFLDNGLPGASVQKSRSAVYGILKEGGDGG